MSEPSQPSASEALAELTPREEMLALALFRNGGNQTAAYLEINPHVTRESAAQLAYREFRKVQVRAAVEALRQELRERVELDVEVLAQRLQVQALGNITDVARWQGGTRPGLELRDSSELTPEQAALIEEVELTPGQWGTKKRVKLVNRTAAARLLLELRGQLAKTVKVEGEIEHRHSMALPEKMPTTEEWLERYGPKRVNATVVDAQANERE